MIYDLHTHHHPATPGTAIVQLTPDAFNPLPSHLYSVGLHPWDIRDDWRTQMAKLLIMALHPQVVMIGEAGLDKINDNVPMEVQKAVFREHVRLSELLRKPLIIHCVKAIDELIAIRKELKPTRPWIIHGYRGGSEQWQQLTRAGIYVSIGYRHDTPLAKAIPLPQLLLESDEHSNINPVYALMSEQTGMPCSVLQQHVDANIRHLLTQPIP